MLDLTCSRYSIHVEVIRNKTTWQSSKDPNSTSRAQSHSFVFKFLTPSWECNWRLSWKFPLCFEFSVFNSMTVFSPSNIYPLGLYKNACCALFSPQPNVGRNPESKTTAHLPHITANIVLCSRKGLLTSQDLREWVCWQWLCVLTYVYTEPRRRTSNALNKVERAAQLEIFILI